MEISMIKDLMESFEKSECVSFEITQADFSLKLEKNSTPVSVVSTVAPQPVVAEVVSAPVIENKQAPAEEGEMVKAPLVGIFYAAPSPEAEAYVQVGSKVEEGQVICLIEAMKMMSEITATKSGVIKKIYVKNQDVVGFEDPLFLIGD